MLTRRNFFKLTAVCVMILALNEQEPPSLTLVNSDPAQRVKILWRA